MFRKCWPCRCALQVRLHWTQLKPSLLPGAVNARRGLSVCRLVGAELPVNFICIVQIMLLYFGLRICQSTTLWVRVSFLFCCFYYCAKDRIAPSAEFRSCHGGSEFILQVLNLWTTPDVLCLPPAVTPGLNESLTSRRYLGQHWYLLSVTALAIRSEWKGFYFCWLLEHDAAKQCRRKHTGWEVGHRSQVNRLV